MLTLLLKSSGHVEKVDWSETKARRYILAARTLTEMRMVYEYIFDASTFTSEVREHIHKLWHEKYKAMEPYRVGGPERDRTPILAPHFFSGHREASKLFKPLTCDFRRVTEAS